MSDSSAHELAHWDNSLAKSTGQLDKDRLIRTAQLARSTSELSSAYEKMANDAEKSWAPIKQQLTQGMYAVGTIFEKGKQLLGAGLSAVLSPVEATGEGIGEMIMGGNFFHGYNNALKPPRGVSMKDSPIMTWMTNLANAPLSVGIQPGHPLAVVPQKPEERAKDNAKGRKNPPLEPLE
jgi:hypothetical protein